MLLLNIIVIFESLNHSIFFLILFKYNQNLIMIFLSSINDLIM